MGIVAKSQADRFLSVLARPVSVPATQTSLTSFVSSAPADASLVAGQFKFWLDATPGSTKLMIKAKDSNGAVRSGSVVLS